MSDLPFQIFIHKMENGKNNPPPPQTHTHTPLPLHVPSLKTHCNINSQEVINENLKIGHHTWTHRCKNCWFYLFFVLYDVATVVKESLGNWVQSCHIMCLAVRGAGSIYPTNAYFIPDKIFISKILLIFGKLFGQFF